MPLSTIVFRRQVREVKTGKGLPLRKAVFIQQYPSTKLFWQVGDNLVIGLGKGLKSVFIIQFFVGFSYDDDESLLTQTRSSRGFRHAHSLTNSQRWLKPRAASFGARAQTLQVPTITSGQEYY
jgi:hypothetical protein